MGTEIVRAAMEYAENNETPEEAIQKMEKPAGLMSKKGN